MPNATEIPMTLLNYGQPFGGFMQIAYTVPDIDAVIGTYVERFHMGPWTVRRFQPPSATYRGMPNPIDVTLAITFTGHMMVELIQQHNDVPSVFQEMIAKSGHGFHHWGIVTQAFDADGAAYVSRGHERVFTDTLPDGTRVAYYDTTRDLPGMVELIEFGPSQERRHTAAYVASLSWDGSDPIRRT
jgi:hypothetical protein